MSFDLTGFVQELTASSGVGELLACVSRAASATSAQPTFAVHILPGRPWDQALVLALGSDSTQVSAPARSALFAIHRKLSLTLATVQIERTPETESIFAGLLPNGPAGLVAVPLLSRSGRVSGALIVGRGVPHESAEHGRTLETIASLAGPALEVAWHHTQARRDQERLQLFSETTEECLWDWNLVTDEVWWGGNLEQIFNGRARVSRRPDWRRLRLHPEDVDRVTHSFDQALAGDGSSWSSEYRIRGDEDLIHVREHVYFLREVDGRAYRAIGTVRDISMLQGLLQREKQARANAERASIVKDEFLAMLGHELRNPLAPIVTALSILERRTSGPDPLLDILQRQTRHLVRMVDDLLDVSRINSGKIDLHKQRMPVEPLIQRALEMVQPVYDQRRHQIEICVPPSLEIDVDSARMTQVLSNLLTNAAKYTEPGGHVHVGAAIENGMAVIRIRDDGIGIAPEFLPTIFDMFSQEPQALNRAQGGLGLGLSIVLNIVRLHGGTVEALSEGAGCGTEVIVRLPLPASSAAAGQPLPSRALPKIRHHDVLVVDDNKDAAATLDAMLALNGHTVHVAHHPDAALELFAQLRPDVALVDIGLPTMDGYELVRRMRAHPDSEGTKFIALTGYGLPSDKAKALGAGFDAHLVKPVSFEHLEQLFGQLIELQGV